MPYSITYLIISYVWLYQIKGVETIAETGTTRAMSSGRCQTATEGADVDRVLTRPALTVVSTSPGYIFFVQSWAIVNNNMSEKCYCEIIFKL